MKLKARVNRSDAWTIRHALEQLPAKCSVRKAGDEFVVEAEMDRSQGCGRHWQRSYSDHDTQKCGVAGTDRDDSHDGSFSVDVRLQLPQSAAGSGSCGNSLLVVYLCVWLLQRDGVLLRVP